MDQQTIAGPKKILVVDDNKVILKAVASVLEANGYQAVTAPDGASVVNIVDREIPDLILLDILFPPDAMDVGMHWDGFAILRWLRNMSEARNVPVIIISGTEPAKYEPLSLAAGAQAFLHKPLDMDELIATVHAVLGETAAAA
jgi:two-component system, OmpR family, KDP operon response regulator KdpE